MLNPRLRPYPRGGAMGGFNSHASLICQRPQQDRVSHLAIFVKG